MYKILFLTLFVFFCASFAMAQDDYHKFEISGGYALTRADGYPGDRLVSSDGTSTSFVTSNPDSTKRRNMNGFDTSAVYNFSKYIGAKFSFSGSYGRDENAFLPGGTFQRTTAPTTILVVPGITGINTRLTQYNYMGGVQIKNNLKEKKIKPFTHFMVGIAQQKTDFTNIDQQRTNILGASEIKNNGFTYALGGGIDIRAGKRLDIRVIQIDYNPVFIKAQTTRAVGDTIDAGVTNFNQVRAFFSNGFAKRRQDNLRIGFGIVFH